ncbi:MAG TPA: CotS family spore coat protein [Ruminiclostridium sp.]|jgi:spore coat protein I|uniref:Spore coat protein n=1 Tax=Acetivibrio saccincola TaxID=1677857 RepID=A0A2K9E0V6_9FIRM|nr:CotS family spore coat protein [Acetivibrio saccincola]AUG57407.1 Spore coat protein I [Acetivibrio saccincola]NLW26557.1 CotS family spore coat protein [Acetivibrio saccincola]PQQ67334.1 spore coat protein [Acetivibrio saccincola]HAA42763.1 CotS family spore coat protein [Ruminiclostridium sp.]
MESKKNHLHQLAKRVLKEYNIIAGEINIVQSGNIKTVWKVKTNNNLFCLKRLKHTYDAYDKALFSVNAQNYIKKSGGNVPGIIKDKNNNLIVKTDGQLFVLYEWLYGKDLNFNNLNDLEKAITGLAKFHVYSKGYVPPADSKISTKLGKRPGQYASMRKKIVSWKSIAKEKQEISSYNTFLKYCDDIAKLSDKALELLESSYYKQLTSEKSDSIVLCHQDYGKGNALLTQDGVYVIDLDGVTFDIPCRDLRKIIGKTSENRGQWDKSIVLDILKWYSKVNPLTPEEMKILFIDLLYPHWFYGIVKNIFKNNKVENSGKIEKIAKLELSKVPLLESLIKRGE